jgi:hypothetical protein
MLGSNTLEKYDRLAQNVYGYRVKIADAAQKPQDAAATELHMEI